MSTDTLCWVVFWPLFLLGLGLAVYLPVSALAYNLRRRRRGVPRAW